MGEAVATDSVEDNAHGLFGLDELPAALSTHKGRLARLDAALERIEAEDEAAKAEADGRAAKAREAAATGRKLRGRKPKDPYAALARAEAEHAAALTRAAASSAERQANAEAAAEKGRKPPGRPPGADDSVERAAAALEAARVAAAAAPPADTQANITDPDSRIMKTKTGYVQGYNCQAAVNENQIVIACGVTQEANDLHQYQPMVDATTVALAAVEVATPIGIVLADAGHWNEANATADGPDRLIATLKDHKQRSAARELGTTTGPPPKDASTLDAMEHRLRTAEGAADYAKRSHTVEPVLGDTKHNRGCRAFRRRGLAAVASEWAMINISHNLRKLHRLETARIAVP